jgi:hypothetical protein
MSFENFKSSGPLRITAAHARDIFEKRIVPSIGAKGPRPQHPTFIMVPASLAAARARRSGRRKWDCQARRKKSFPTIPGHHDVARISPADAAGCAEQAGLGSFIQETVRRAENMRANIILECAVPAGSAQHAARYRQMGYRSELHIVATPHYQSWTGVLDRAEKALSNGHIGTNVLCPRDAHDETYAGWARAVFDAEQRMQYDRVVITRRDGNVMYDNHLVRQRDGTVNWAKPAQALESLLVERHRAVSGIDATRAKDAWDRIVNSPHMKSDPYLKSLPLAAYGNEIVNFVGSEASRVTLTAREPDKFSANALKQWHAHITADLSVARRSRNQFGRSDEFDGRIHRYGEVMTNVAKEYYRSRPITRPENTQSQERAGRNFSLPTGTKRTFDRLHPGTGAPSASRNQEATSNKANPPKLEVRKESRSNRERTATAVANEADRSRRSPTQPENTQSQERARIRNFSLPTGTKRTFVRLDATGTGAPSASNNSGQTQRVELPKREDAETFKGNDGERITMRQQQMNQGRDGRQKLPTTPENAGDRDSAAASQQRQDRLRRGLEPRDRSGRGR